MRHHHHHDGGNNGHGQQVSYVVAAFRQRHEKLIAAQPEDYQEANKNNTAPICFDLRRKQKMLAPQPFQIGGAMKADNRFQAPVENILRGSRALKPIENSPFEIGQMPRIPDDPNGKCAPCPLRAAGSRAGSGLESPPE